MDTETAGETHKKTAHTISAPALRERRAKEMMRVKNIVPGKNVTIERNTLDRGVALLGGLFLEFWRTKKGGIKKGLAIKQPSQNDVINVRFRTIIDINESPKLTSG